MSPRPRKATDDEVFAATHRVMQRVGPSRLRLTDIAAEAGVTASALVQRFGSKRGLLVALSEGVAASTHALFDQLRATHRSPLAALRAYANCFAGMAEPTTLAHHLAYLQADLADPDLRRQVRLMTIAAAEAIRALLDDAVKAGELRKGTDTARLARSIQVVLSGSMMTWAFLQEGSASAYMAADLEAALAPFLRPSSATGSKSRLRRLPQ